MSINPAFDAGAAANDTASTLFPLTRDAALDGDSDATPAAHDPCVAMITESPVDKPLPLTEITEPLPPDPTTTT